MARVGRTRERTFTGSSGQLDYKFQTNLPVTDFSNHALSQDRCVDSKGSPVVDSDLSVRHSDYSGVAPIDGKYTSDDGMSFAVASNYHPPRIRAPNGDIIAARTTGWPINPNLNVSATIAARTNPNRPSIVAGHLIQDLVDIPKMLKQIGDLLRSGKSAIGAHGVANNALAAKFGWIPLFQDITLLLREQEFIDKRNDELNRLFSKGGLRRRVNVMKLTNHVSSSEIVSSGYPLGVTTGRVDTINTSTQWGVCRWKPAAGTPAFNTVREQIKMAQRLVNGATASGTFASSWDLIPWTWLLGWFTNTRDYVLAHGNTVPVVLSGPINMMLMNEQTRSFHGATYDHGFGPGIGDATHRWKTRKIYSNVAHTARLPYLTGDRLSTLSLLAVQRLRR